MVSAHSKSRILIAVATPIEANALREPLGFSIEAPEPWVRYESGSGCDIVVTGVGKANAAGAVALTLDPLRHAGVLNVGIAGVLPKGISQGLEPGCSVLATTSVFADEGVQGSERFESFSELGFGLCGAGDGVDGDRVWLRSLSNLVDAQGPIATVSTCSGTDELALEIQGRADALAEACEGAGCGLSALRRGVLFCELRVISNTTGERAKQRWDLGLALTSLGALLEKADLPARLVEPSPAGDTD